MSIVPLMAVMFAAGISKPKRTLFIEVAVRIQSEYI